MPRTVLSWSVAACAASAALAAGFLLPVNTYMAAVAAVVLAAIVVIGLTVQMGRPSVGLAVLIVTAVAMPVEFRGPSAAIVSTSLPLAACLCGVWLLHSVFTGSLASFDRSRVTYAALAFMGLTLVSFAAGQFPWYPTDGAPLPAQVAELGIFLTSVCLFLAVGHQVRSLAQLKWVTWLFVAAGSFAVVVQTFGSLASAVGPYTTRPGSIGSLFWTWLVALTVAQALFNRRLTLPARLWLLALNGLVFYHSLVQVRSWASGWLPPLAGLGVILLIAAPRLITGVAVVAGPVALIFSSTITTWLLADEAYSLSSREAAWETLWHLFTRSPLVGTGLANYYYYTLNLPVLGWYVRFISHNNYQDLLIQTGLLGLLGFCWLAFELFWLTFQMYRRLPSGFAKAYALGALGGLAGSLAAGLLGDWFIPFYYNAGILGFRSSLLLWVFLGGVLALKRMSFSPAAAAEVSRSRAREMPRSRQRLVEAL